MPDMWTIRALLEPPVKMQDLWHKVNQAGTSGSQHPLPHGPFDRLRSGGTWEVVNPRSSRP